MRCTKCKTPIPPEEGIRPCGNPQCNCIHLVYKRSLLLRQGFIWDHLCINKEDEFAKRFRLRKLLGAGAHAVTVEAWDTLFERDVAARIMRRANLLAFRTKEEQLVAEARTYAKVDHENVAKLFELSSYWDSYKKEKVPFLVMQLVKGKTLSGHLKDGSLPKNLDFVRQFILKIFWALIHCHSMGVYHGDLHEKNIVVMEPFTPVLLDFSVSDFRKIIPALRKKKADIRSMIMLCRRMYDYCGEEHRLKFVDWEGASSIELLRNAYLNGLGSFEVEEKLIRVLASIEKYNNAFSKGGGLYFKEQGMEDAEVYTCDIWQITEDGGFSAEYILQAIQYDATDIQKLCKDILGALLEAVDRIVCALAPSKFRRSDVEPTYPEFGSFVFYLFDGGFATSLREVLLKLEKSVKRTVLSFLQEWTKRVNTRHFQESKRVLDILKGRRMSQ